MRREHRPAKPVQLLGLEGRHTDYREAGNQRFIQFPGTRIAVIHCGNNRVAGCMGMHA